MCVAFTKLPPLALSTPVTTTVTGPATASGAPPDSVTLWKQYVPSASAAALPPLTLRSPVAALYVNLPLIPDAPLNGEHAATRWAAIGGDGEFGVAVPLIVPRLVIAVPARTLRVTSPPLSRLTGPRAARTLPFVVDELSPTVLLLKTSAALPLLPEPYGPADES